MLTCDSDKVCIIVIPDGTRRLPSEAHAPSEKPEEEEEFLSSLASGEEIFMTLGVEMC